MKKLSIPENYPRYYTAAYHPEIIDVENANFFPYRSYTFHRGNSTGYILDRNIKFWN